MRTSKPVTNPLYTIVKRKAPKGVTFVADFDLPSTKSDKLGAFGYGFGLAGG